MASPDSGTSRTVLLVLAVLLAVMSQLPAAVIQPLSSRPQRLIEVLHAPLSRLLLKITNSAMRTKTPPPVAADPDDYGMAMSRIRQLEAEVAELQRLNDELAGLRRRSERINPQLARRALVPARVTAVTGDPAHPLMTLDRGTRDGVSEESVVVTGWSLVGRLVDVGPLTSTLRLLTAPDARLEVRIAPPTIGLPPRQTITTVRYEPRLRAFVAVVGRDQQVEITDLATMHLGDLRLTRGVWPPEAQGFAVGAVTRIEDDPDDPQMKQRLIIEPLQPLDRLSRVIIICRDEP